MGTCSFGGGEVKCRATGKRFRGQDRHRGRNRKRSRNGGLRAREEGRWREDRRTARGLGARGPRAVTKRRPRGQRGRRGPIKYVAERKRERRWERNNEGWELKGNAEVPGTARGNNRGLRTRLGNVRSDHEAGTTGEPEANKAWERAVTGNREQAGKASGT